MVSVLEHLEPRLKDIGRFDPVPLMCVVCHNAQNL
jgi:hypothetical protein